MSRVNSILLVDDDPIQIALLTAYFTSLGIGSILSANNSAQALSKIASNDGDLDMIVTDLQMPEMDGLEFLRHLRELEFKGQLAIISGVGSNLLEHAARLAKMHKLNLIAQLGKPLSKDALDCAFKRTQSDSVAQAPRKGLVITQDEFTKAMSRGDIVPHYQPKIEVGSRQVTGAESLARWNKEDFGNISPEVFIEYATKNGRIGELTFNLFEQTLKHLTRFLEIDPNTKIAVNLAPEMIDNISLPDQLGERIRAHGLSAKNISFEITENSTLNLKPTTLEVLSRLRIQDFEIAVDDFGTGSSNIQSLRDFPYSELKIDRSFITDVTTNVFSRETVHAAIALARQQGMKIVAEGIEDKETWDFLNELGVDQAQGYLMAKPMPAEDYCKFLKENSSGLELSSAA